jgi:hypothetical protein
VWRRASKGKIFGPLLFFSHVRSSAEVGEESSCASMLLQQTERVLILYIILKDELFFVSIVLILMLEILKIRCAMILKT